MTITTVNVATITEAVVQLLRDAMPGVNVSRAEEINELPHLCPWVGVYRSSVSFPPRTLGLGTGFRDQSVELILVVQQADGSSGAECEDLLEKLIGDTVSTVLSSPSLGGSVLVVDDVNIRYSSYEKRDSVYFQTATIYFTARTRVIFT